MAGEPSHFELGVRDAARAKRFYGELLGWQFQKTKGEWAQVETGGVPGGVHDGGDEHDVIMYFAVPDIEAAVRRVRELGGEGEEPGPPTLGGRYARCRDDQSVVFGLHQPG